MLAYPVKYPTFVKTYVTLVGMPIISRKYCRVFLLAVCLACLAIATPAHAGIVVGEQTGARAMPGYKYRVVERIPARIPLLFLDRKEVGRVQWYKVRSGVHRGWVAKQRIRYTAGSRRPRCRAQAFGSAGFGWLRCGHVLPAEGTTWTSAHARAPHPGSYARRFAADKTIRRIKELTSAYAHRFPAAPRIVIGDISRKGGGHFPGHSSHQQGLDVDIYFPRSDNTERSPIGGGINYYRARWLIVRAARHPSTQVIYAGAGLSNVHRKVAYYTGHETHLHWRIRK